MKRILFVDDELSMLDGLRNLLRKQRRQWDIAFACGGAAGLEEMAKAPFDVVVSDMRMPQMDGVAFLATVKRQYPELGAFLLGTWGLPAPLVAAVARHHTPATAAPKDVDLTIAVHVADALVADGMAAGTRPGCLDLEALATFGVTGELPGWCRVAERVTSRTRTNDESHAGGRTESSVG